MPKATFNRPLNPAILRNLFCTSVALLLLPGCDSVVIDQPIGNSLTLDQKKDLCGRWVDDEWNFADINLNGNGDLVGGSLTWDEETSAYTVNSESFDVRVVGANRFLYFKADNRYLFFWLKRIGDSQVEFIAPDPDRFKEAIKQMKLEGTVTKTDNHFQVLLKSDSDKVRTLLADAKVLLNFSARRISRSSVVSNALKTPSKYISHPGLKVGTAM